MAVDFGFRRAPRMRIISLKWKSPWSDRKIRSKFEELARWASKRKLKTGPWVFMEPNERTFEVGIVVPARAKGEKSVRVRTLPAARVACVEYDPDEVSPRVIYHGLNDWLKWRKKDRSIKSVGTYREVYRGNPWTDAKAWAHSCVEVVVH